MSDIFRDRADAGRQVAAMLGEYAGRADVLVLALPRGGVPVAYEVARALDVALDVFLVRKLGVPGHEELAMGALASGGTRVLNDEVISSLRIPREAIDAATVREQRELERRERAYRDDLPPPTIAGRTILLVDDGVATGSTVRAAIRALRRQHPARLVVAVPTAAPSICESLAQEVDQMVCVITPEPFYAVGLWYQDFSETTDAEIRDLLRRAADARAHSDASRGATGTDAGDDTGPSRSDPPEPPSS